MHEPPLAANDYPQAAHDGADFIQPHRRTLKAKVLTGMANGKWWAPQAMRQIGGDQADRRRRELAQEGWPFQQKRGTTAPWVYRLTLEDLTDEQRTCLTELQDNP